MTDEELAIWRQARCGKITASRIADMVARTKSGWGASRANYMAELVIERITGVPVEGFKSKDMIRGTELEPQACDAYSFYHDVDLTECGFVLHPKIAMAGASPDRLVGDIGMVQFKCPNLATHMATLLEATIDGGYVKQMQWELACQPTRQWCDFTSFHPEVPPRMQLAVRRVRRDDAMIAELEREAGIFDGEIRTKVAALTERFGKAA